MQTSVSVLRYEGPGGRNGCLKHALNTKVETRCGDGILTSELHNRIYLSLIVQLTIVADCLYGTYLKKHSYIEQFNAGSLMAGVQVRLPATGFKKEDVMLWTIAVVLMILWLLGLVTGYTMGYFIHILLVVAIIVVLVRVIQGRRPL